MIIERLQRVVYRMNAGRSSNRVSTIPDGVHFGPKVLLINKYSASDGDLFPWGFKANKLGTVIGTRTWGGIVGIGGSLPYMDGTDVRVPGSTSFDPNTGARPCPTEGTPMPSDSSTSWPGWTPPIAGYISTGV